ncbi:unnamed protein product (macronuclear) [Paramecium tetraurelia]|uniref:Uncharacterized protein n=1 Tax=Paramecium tetraurelia TaxID=5888 RepID=A0DY04_PARTE|nr:uncharacterized protein GSPATT00021545001 [Paramecium tetraurelia]CAK87921.1 unnamed protein product [Paramecium tetraurelia]|eukprot:XP_001455318.1 hypothetical protein (macronuclear) [Paramecium tetraurelia strain d4-2]
MIKCMRYHQIIIISMLVSPSRRLVKRDTKSMRPSMFLNEFNISSVSQLITVKKEVNESSTRSVDTFGSVTQGNEIPDTLFLPFVEEKPRIRYIKSTSKPKQSLSNRKVVLLQSNSNSPLTQSEIHLPQINSIPNSPTRFQITNHKRHLSNIDEQYKKVEFRKSIQVIDFVNNIITKDVIDGSVKPLKKKLQRQQTKMVKKE